MKQNHRRYQFPDGSNYPVHESDAKMLLLPTEEDAAHATPRDPERCVLAQCAMRNGAKKAFIAGTVAYVVMPVKGQEVAVKFSLPASTRRAIKTYDESQVFPLEGFEFGKLKRSQTSEAKREWNAKRTPEQRKWTGKNGEVGDRDLRTYRYLTGQVHTTAGA